MKPSDQNDLIAYHLHELSPRKERALRRKLATDAELAAESAAIGATLLAFPRNEPSLPLDAAALERHWLAIHPLMVLHPSSPIALPSPLRGWHWPAIAGTAFAAAAILIASHHYRHTQPSTIAIIKGPTEIARSVQPSAPPTNSASALFPGAQPNASTPRQQIINRNLLPPTAPFGTESAQEITKAFPGMLPAEPLSSLTPTEQSPAPIGIISTADAASLPIATTLSPRVKSRGARAVHHTHTTDVTLGIFADLTATTHVSTSTSGTGSSLLTESNAQTASAAVGALASFHQQFRPWLGYRVTATYFHPTVEYPETDSNSSEVYGTSLGLVSTQVYEFGGTYVVQGPHRRRITPSVEAGASVLDFVPNPNQSQTTSIRAAAIVGVSAEYSLTNRLSLRAEYRAQIYKAPAFSNTDVTGILYSTNTTFSSNPILGITYHFGKTGND